MMINLPNYVISALKILNDAGFEAYCVGGAIRDHLLGITPFDYDITTNAKPSNIISLFEKTVPTGIKHGTVTVIIDDFSIEITTYRTDGEYLDHRSPENVNFVSSVLEDVKRRDFTVNSILYHPKIGFYDPQNGISDINNKIIRTVGDPNLRFEEDALRILRAFRFSSQLGFTIESSTINSALQLAPTLRSISVERIFIEFKKIIISKSPNFSSPLFELGTFEFLGISRCNLSKIDKLPNEFSLRFAYLCRSYNLNPTTILKNLKADNQTIKDTENLYKILSSPVPKTKAEIKYLLRDYGLDSFSDFCSANSLYISENPILSAQFNEILENNEPFCINQLDISGDDLKKHGLSGIEIGQTLDRLLNHVIIDPSLNQKDKLLTLI